MGVPGFRVCPSTLRVFPVVFALLFFPVGCAEQKEGREGAEGDTRTRIAWGAPARGLTCGLSFSKSIYKVGEPIEGTFYLYNMSTHDVKILKPKRLRDWDFEILGPPFGNYDWKGPRVEWGSVEDSDFTVLKPGSIHEEMVEASAQIEQTVEAGEPDWDSVIPGKYRIRIRMWIHGRGDDSWAGRARTGEVEIRVVQ